LCSCGTIVLYTVSNLIIADAFPLSKQSLAGGVFNMVSQIGNSFGLTVGAVIASAITGGDDTLTSISGQELEVGYRATFWICFASMAIVALASLVGLKKAGKVGLKIE
jgi:MFS family permease